MLDTLYAICRDAPYLKENIQWTLPIAYEVLIGKKNDPFCFQTFPGNDSVRNVIGMVGLVSIWYVS